MSPLVRLYVKTSLVFLLLGLALGAYITLEVNVAGRGVPWPLITAHVHLLLVGFLLMLVFGVATWMFPRPAREDARYRPELAHVVYWAMTGGTAARAAAEILVGLHGTAGLRPLIAAAGITQLVDAGLFVVNMWSRVRMPAPAPTPGPAAPPRA